MKIFGFKIPDLFKGSEMSKDDDVVLKKFETSKKKSDIKNVDVNKKP